MQSTTSQPAAAEAAEEQRRTADVLIDVLIDAGVNVVFGLPGGTIAPLHDALLDRPDVRVITARHESGAMFAAAGYARSSGKLGVVIVTSGPGILNAVTGLANAHCEGLPILVIAGEVPRALHGRRALQEGTSHHLDVVGIASHVTKLALEVPFPNLAPALLRRAIATALSGRPGPVVLTLPLDVSSASIRPPDLAGEVSLNYSLESPATQRSILETAKSLRTAERPVIFAGSGTRWGSAPTRLRELAERLQIPVMTTPKAKGIFPESHPLSLGVFGHGGHPSSRAYLEGGIDAILAIGTSLNDPATDGWSPLLAAKRHFIHVDADAAQLGRNYPVTRGIVGDASAVLAKLLEHLPDEGREAKRFGVERFADASACQHGPEDRITPQRALWELQQAMPRDTIYTCDIGEHMLFATHYLEIDDPQGYMMMTGLASMGTSIPGAIGARIALPDRPVVAICGDGGFSMMSGDVAMAALYRIPLVIAVFNDMRFGMVEIGLKALYGRSQCYSTAPMSVVDVGAGAGARAMVIEHSGEILACDLAALAGDGPVVLDIRIDRRVQMPKNRRFEELRAVTRKRVLN